MASALDDFLNKIDVEAGGKPVSQTPAVPAPPISLNTPAVEQPQINQPVAAPATNSNLDVLLNDIEAKSVVHAPQPSFNAPAAPATDLDSLLTAVDQAPARPGLGTAFIRGAESGIEQFKQLPTVARGLYAEATGDVEGAAAAGAELAAHPEQPKIVEDWTHIHNSSDAAYWFVERLGEQAPNLLAMLTGAGTAGAAANVVGRKLAVSAASRALLARSAQAAGGLSVSVPLETASTAEEQRAATGSFQPAASIAAGLVKGGLEFYTPFKFMKDIHGPIPSIVGYGLKSAAREGITEGAQESIDIGLRAYTDPNYALLSKQTGIRLGEAVLTGGAVGHVTGTGVAALSKVGEDKGFERKVDPEEFNFYPAPGQPGVLTWLRNRTQKSADVDVGMEQAVDAAAGADPTNVGAMLSGVTFGSRFERKKLSDMQLRESIADDHTPRYMVRRNDGSLLSVALNAAGLEREMSTMYPSSTKPDIYEVNMNSLVPAGISASVEDLQNLNPERILFLPHVAEEAKAKLTQDLQRLSLSVHQKLSVEYATQRSDLNAISAAYDALLDQGIRVVPNPGTSFTYIGPLKGKAVKGIPETGRAGLSVHPSDIKLGTVKSGTLLAPAHSKVFETITAVGVDLDAAEAQVPGRTGIGYSTLLKGHTLDKDNLIEPHVDMLMQPGATTAENLQQLRLIEEAHFQATDTVDLLARLKALAKRGIALKTSLDQALITDIDLPAHTLTHSPAHTSENATMARQYVNIKTKFGADATKVVTQHVGRTAFQQAKIANIAKYTTEAAPYITELAKRLGIKNKPVVFVTATEDAGIGPHYTGANSIVFPVPEESSRKFASFEQGLSQRQGVFNVLVHEFGHAVTLHSFSQLPEGLQGAIYSSYQRALIRRAKFAESTHLNALYDTDYINSYMSKPWDAHYLAFDEWMAEQFRRWAMSSANAITDLEQAYKAGANELSRYQRELYDLFGPEVYEDLFTSDWAFNLWMEYLEATAFTPKSPMMLKKLFGRVDTNYQFSSQLVDVIAQTKQALTQMQALIPEGVSIQVVEEIDGQPDYVAAYMPEQRIIQLAVGALAYKAQTDNQALTTVARKAVAHEAFHAVQHLLSQQERSTLLQAAIKEEVLTANEIASYRANYTTQLKEAGAFSEHAVQLAIEFELIAHLIEARANGKQFDSKLSALLDKLLEMIKRVADVFIGNGLANAEDIIRSFYKGEMSRRIEPADIENAVRTQIAQAMLGETVYDEIRNVAPDLAVGMHFTGIKTLGVPITAVYDFYPAGVETKAANRIGFVNLAQRGDKGYEVEYVEINDSYRGKGFFERFYTFVEQDLSARTGIKTTMKPSGLLTYDGYRKWQKRAPDWVKWHIKSTADEVWMSPNYIRKNLQRWTDYVEDMKLRKRPDEARSGQALVKKYKELESRVKSAAWKDPNLKKMFMRQHQLSAMVNAQTRSEGELQRSLGAPAQPSLVDPFSEVLYQKQVESRIASAKLLGVPLEQAAYAQPELRHLRKMFSLLQPGSRDPNVARYLNGIMGEADRVSWFSKTFLGLKQLAWRNPQNPFLHSYVTLSEQWNAKRMQWISRADEPARRWAALPRAQQEALSEMAFWATEMNYRARHEVANNVVRHPTQSELQRHFQRLRATPETQQLYFDIIGHPPSGVVGIFGEFLHEIEQISAANLTRTFQPNSPQLLKALQDLATEMQQLRQRPYFPLARFGRHTITVRDIQTQEVVWFSTYHTAAERDAAVRQVAHTQPGDLSIGRVPETAMEFMGLPGPLLRLIKQNLPGLTTQQVSWIDNMTHLMSPERSFRKRWLERKGVPGYSRDGLRSFSNYFLTGANYLSRVEYKDVMQEAVDALEARARRMPDSNKAMQTFEFAHEHMRYIMEGGRDWVKIKALTSIWQLGFSPAATLMNLTQVPLVTEPYLSNVFGGIKAKNALLKSIKTLKHTFGYPPTNAAPAYVALRNEMIEQGKIETGQAPEMGGFAEGSNLQLLQLGTAAQRAWQNLSYWSMIGFSWAERFNRETSFHAAYHLALQQPTIPHMRQLETRYFTEIGHLMAKHNVTHEEALAFIAARDVVDATQFVYSPWARPKFLRSSVASTMLIFFQYTQSMLFALGNNPGKTKMLVYMAVLYGLAGLPGSDDLDKMIRAVSRRLLGKDFSPHESARKLTRDFTRGTVLDEVGPDLVMHGISRYGFGWGLMPDGWGVPRFDASTNGSMGRIVPGLQNAARAVGNSDSWEKLTAEIVKDASGAGFGQMFALLQFLGADPQSNEQKHWEKIMPRAFKAASKAHRYYTEGVETNNRNVPIATFDKTDPDDLATIAAQLAGFTPTKVSSRWESIIATVDKIKFYKTQRNMLFIQMDIATQHKDPEAKAEVLKRIRDFNERMQKDGVPTYVISGDSLRKSLAARARSRAMQSKGLPPNKMDIPINRQVQDLYPGVQFDQQVPDVE